MNNIFTKYLKGDRTIWIVFIMLCVFSVIEMYSASSTLAFKAANYTAPVLQHVSFLALGAFIAFLVHFVPYKYVRLLSYIRLVVSFVLLIYVLIKGESANDASRWVRIMGIQFQPSEIAKLSLVIVVADLISRVRANPAEEKKYFIRILVVSGIIIGLILLENFSTAAILGLVVFAMMFIGQISWKRLGILTASLIGALLLGVLLIKIVPQERNKKYIEK